MTANVSQPARPLVSIVITCYNHARFLREAIQSALAQTYPCIETLVVDDGSMDDTAGVAAQYPAVRYIYQNNQGLSTARNTGLRESRGELLVFLDADDRLLPGAVEHGVCHLLGSPECAFVSGRYRYITEDGAVIREYGQRPADPDPYTSFLLGNYVGMHAAVVYRRDAIEAEGGFNPLLPACEDYDLYLRITKKHRVLAHGHVVAEYRQHGENMSADPKLMMKAALTVLNANWKYVRLNANYRRAYRSGVKSLREYYSGYFFDQIMKKWSLGKMGIALDLVWHWFRYAPRQMAGYLFWRAAEALVRPFDVVMPLFFLWFLASKNGKDYVPAKGKVRFGDYRRLRPISREFGFDRGLPIDRYYVERFLRQHAADIHGHVMEVGDDSYMCRFGGKRVLKKDILHVAEGNPAATIVADLTRADHIPSNQFDCIILTQTLHFIYDVEAAIQTLLRILKPGGVLLATFPGISQLSNDEWSQCWYWSFTLHSAHRMFEKAFPAGHFKIQSHGNVLAATAFLQGLAVDELKPQELDYPDPQYQVLLTVRAVKPEKQ